MQSLSRLLGRSRCRPAIALLLAIVLPHALAQSALAQSAPVPSVPTQSAPDPATSPAFTSPGYVLGVGDQITVTVFGYEEFTGPQSGPRSILPDGTITLPLVGSIPAAGQTIDSLARDLTARLNTVLVDPYVAVSLNTLRPVVVNVAGEVQRPGPIQLSSTTSSATNTATGVSNSVPTVSSAIAEAGGITRNADIREVVVRRVLPGGSSTTLTVNLWDAISSDTALQDVVLQAGDAVFVPRLAADATIDRRVASRSSFAPQTVRVRVVGEVNAPGQLEISPDSSLSSAIASAGGPTEDARLSQVALIRLNDDGSVGTEEIDLRDLNDASQVQEGDVIVVPEQGSSSFLRGLGRVLAPLGSLLGIFDRF